MKKPERGAYLYARVKAIMILRKSGDLRNAPGLRHPHLRLPLALAGALVVLTLLAGSSGAGISAYQGTLYLAGPASSVPGTSWQLTTAAGPAVPAAPTIVAGAAGSGTLTAATYQYIYVRSSGGASTASAVSNAVAVLANGSVTVSVAPAELGGDLYRAKSSGVVLGNYVLAASGVSTVPFVDTGAVSAAALPQADTRHATGAPGVGWSDFVPGTGLATTVANSSVSGSAPAIPSTCKGWVVDAYGGMSFAAQNWTFQARIKPGAINNGTALLTAAMWKVDDSGNTVGGYLVAPTDGDVITNAGGTAVTATVTANPGAFILASNEHLCVQFGRHQTVAYTNGGTNHTISLLAYDSANRITVHPAPNAFATPVLSSPADGARSKTPPTLAATFTDPDGDAGTLTFRVCSDSTCSAPALQTSSAIPATNGATLTWPPTGPLSDGTYYWQAQAKDTPGLPSAWTASRSFVIVNVAPTASIDSSPPANSNAASGTFAFSANEAVAGFQCKIDGGAFAACPSPSPYGPLADGSHTFSVEAIDLAGNVGAPVSHTWTVDTVAPDTSLVTQPPALTNSAAPSFTFSATQAGSTFQCALDGSAFSACSRPKSYAGLADGGHTFQVRAVDPANNIDASPASYVWNIDATAPNTSIGPSQPALTTNATDATFDFSSDEVGSTFACSLDGSVFTACTTPKSYSTLAEGSHTFQVRATDTATNVDATPASYTWTIDTTRPVTSIGPSVPAAHTFSTGASFDLLSNETGSTFECRLDAGAFTLCSTPQTYAGLADGTHTFDVRATDQAGNVDSSPASYLWAVDNVAPSTPNLVSPADASFTNALPQLRASFDDATAGGDSGIVEFQLCSASAAAGTSCAPVVQSNTSASLSSGANASWSPAALPDGTFHWQARARDLAGNQSAWSATRSFQLDTSIPTVPAAIYPEDGAWVPRIRLKARFSKPSFAGTGSLEFRICSDALCLGAVRTGSSGTLINGQLSEWTPSTQPGNGLWYWQVRAHDQAGNTSPWSVSRVVHLDSVAPGSPPHFNGQVAGDGLTLRWDAPNDAIANYVVFVNGDPWKNFGSTEHEVKMGAFDASDTRTFSVVAVDLAGNVGTMSPVLVGVPDLMGLDWEHASGAAAARGLKLKRDAAPFGSLPMFVSSQDPPAPSLAERGSTIQVTLAAAEESPLAVRVRPGIVKCARTCVVRLRIELSSSALVRSRLLNRHGRLVKSGRLGSLHAGSNSVRVKLPKRLSKGAYRLVFDASGRGRVAHALVHVKVI